MCHFSKGNPHYLANNEDFGMGDTGLEPVASCVSIRHATHKPLFYKGLDAHFLSIYRKYTGKPLSTCCSPPFTAETGTQCGSYCRFDSVLPGNGADRNSLTRPANASIGRRLHRLSRRSCSRSRLMRGKRRRGQSPPARLSCG